MKEKLQGLITALFPFVILLGIVLTPLGCGFFSSGFSDETVPKSWKNFRSALGQFAIDYPSNWSGNHFTKGYHNDMEAIALFTSDAAFPVVIIAQREMVSPSLDDVALWGEERIMAINDNYNDKFELHDLEDVEINGMQAKTREYLMDLETVLPLKKKDIYIIHDNYGLIITFTSTAESYDNMIGIFDQMISSFEFINS
ncbi:MAG: hypothetical protein H6667_02310 [Ardenticatenaceae bacterium]|nr:hypothetical protein [Ardenticatenaceae bacterium]MCB9443343.1 hypothetical protein [Ardenticatenaceae bacterium]